MERPVGQEISIAREFTRYRELLRSTWNALIADDPRKIHSYGFFGATREFKEALLKLVFYDFAPEDLSGWCDLKDFAFYARNEWSFSYIPTGPEPTPFLIGTYIAVPPNTLFKIESFYDLGNMTTWDLQYVVVSIEECTTGELVGQRGLLEARWIEPFAIQALEHAGDPPR